VREVFFYLCVCVRVFGILEWSRKWRDKIEYERRGGEGRGKEKWRFVSVIPVFTFSTEIFLREMDILFPLLF